MQNQPTRSFWAIGCERLMQHRSSSHFEKHPDLRIFKGFYNMNLRIFVYFMEINSRIFNIIRIFALRKYQIVSNFYIKNKEKNI